MIPNLYIGHGCFTKHPCLNGCLGFQVHIQIITYVYYNLTLILCPDPPTAPTKAPVDLALMRRKLRCLVFERKDECQVACSDMGKMLQRGRNSTKKEL